MATKSIKDAGTFVEFPEGLSVLVREGTNIEIVRKPFGSAPEPSGKGVEPFKIIRPLVNFGIAKKNGDSQVFIGGEVKLLVRFNEQDLEMAEKKEGALVFAYYHGGKWRKFPHTEDNVERYASDGFGGFDLIEIPDWPADPGGAWGV